MNILITGSSGFIASKLMNRLQQDGNNYVEGFDLSKGQNILNYTKVCDAVKNQDAVLHLAAVADLNWARAYPHKTEEINVDGTWNLAWACHEYGVKLFFASTCCVYGNQFVHPSTELTSPNPSEIYAATKLAGESLIKGIHHTYGLDYNLMRFATIYGSGTRPALATHIFLGQALRGEPITVHGTGEQTRTLTYIDDLVDAIVALLKSGKINDTWNLTTEEEVSAIQMAREIVSITQSRSKITLVPDRIGQTFKESISARKMKEEVGWQAKMPFPEGIQKMYKWFVETNQIENKYEVPR
jgi:UDP-glucuronate decarboxylase